MNEHKKSPPQGLFLCSSDSQKTCPVTGIGGKDTIDWQGQTRLTACLSGAFCSFRLGLRQQACGSKTKNHSKIHRWQVQSSFAGAEMCPDEKKPAENTCRIVKGLDAVWAHFCPPKPCLPLSSDGKKISRFTQKNNRCATGCNLFHTGFCTFSTPFSTSVM